MESASASTRVAVGASTVKVAADVTTIGSAPKFRVRGKVSQPVWKGKVELYVFGREKPVQSVSIEKVCPWDGKKFAPLR